MMGSTQLGGNSVLLAGSEDGCDHAASGPPAPPSEGLILWLKGDAGITELAGLVTAMADQSGFGQDFGTDVGFEPKTGIANIDGINCVSFDLASTAYLLRLGGIKDRNAVLMGYNVGETQSLTVMAAFRPGATSFGFFGGEVFHRNGTAQPPFQALFDLEHTNRPDGFWLASTAWRDYTASNRGPDTPPATYDGIPTLAQWSSPAFPSVAVAVNNAPVVLTPANLPGVIGGATTALAMFGNVLRSGFGLAFVADIAELIVWDYDLTTAPAEQQEAVDYFAARFPSLVLA